MGRPRTVEDLIEQLRAEGVPESELEKVREASDEAAERNAVDDPEQDRLADEYLTAFEPANPKDARRWKVLDANPLGGVVLDNTHTGRRVLLSINREADGEVWLHGSVSRADRQIPTYEDLVMLHRDFMRSLLAYQLFVPPDEHYNLTTTPREILHLWAPLTGPRRTPDFRSRAGTV